MRHFFSTILDTVAQRLHGETPARDPVQLLRIRHAMLALLPADDGLGSDWPSERLRHRLLVATDPHALWFMRADLNQLLCRRLGERPAFALMAQLTPLFQGAIAPCWISRAPPPRRASARIADPTRQ